MAQIPPVRNFAPYVYLVNNSLEGYVLFVCIHLMEGTMATYKGNAGDKYQFEITDKQGEAAKRNYYRLDVTAGTPPVNEFGIRERRTIMTEVLHRSNVTDSDTKSSYKVGIDVNDADTKPVPLGDTAENRPYLYLTNSNADLSGEPDENDLLIYVPRCHVPLKDGWGLLGNTLTIVNGKCIEEIQLVENGTHEDQITPGNIESNLHR